MQAKREYSSQCLSFNSYSNKNLAEIADRVVEEFKAENGTDEDLFGDVNGDLSFLETERMLNHDKAYEKQEEEQSNADEDDEFEFSFVKESEISPVAADEIFHNGQIRPIYPLFNRNLLSDKDEFMNGSSNSNSKPKSIRLPLRKLFLEEERDANNSSCSSSEADDLEGIPEGTYCVWRPKTEEKSAGSCKKSNSTGSTGSSKRWKFRDLLYRSNSDGKDNFVFLTPSFKRKDNKTEKTTTTTTTDNASKVTGKSKGIPVVEGSPAMHNYLKNGGGEKRKTYLPYRQDLVGLFANMNGMSKNVMPL